MKYRLLAALAVLLLAWIPQAAAQARTLVFCSEASPDGFNPQLYTSAATFDASSRQIYNRLVEYKPGTTELAPALAESWEVSADGLIHTFRLRRGVRFHRSANFTPTRDFNADDVIFSFERQRNPEHPFHAVSGGKYPYFEGMDMGSLLNTVTRVDDYTVAFSLSRRAGSLPYLLAMDFASILSAEYAGAMMAAGTPEKLDSEPVGTGPFQLVQYQADALIRYVAYPDYWAGKAALDNLVFLISPDAAVRAQKLRSGECQVIASPFPADIPSLENDPDIVVIRQTGPDIGFLAFNTRKAPFNDTRVRAALVAAVDRELLLRAAFQGLGTLAEGPIPPTFQAYEESKPAYPYDPDWARKILAEAGVVDLKTEIWAMPVYRPYLPNARHVAELIREDWLKVGVDAKIIIADWVEFLKLSMTCEHETILFGWVGETGDPDNILYPTLSCATVETGGNRARWCYEPFDALLRHARSTADITERTALYRAAQRIFQEQAPWITLAHSVSFTPIRAQVTGYRASPLGGHYFYGVNLR